jgi:hypothetical protein
MLAALQILEDADREGCIECKIRCGGADGTQLAPALFNTIRAEQIVGLVS